MVDRRTATHRFVGVLGTALLLVGLSACAPEPGEEAGATNSEVDTVNPETEWGGTDVAEDDPVTELPETFPVDEFQLPDGVTILNTGERAIDEWFLVLRASDDAEAVSVWESVLELNGLSESDSDETSEGGHLASLIGGPLTIEAMSIPAADGTFELSYEISREISDGEEG